MQELQKVRGKLDAVEKRNVETAILKSRRAMSEADQARAVSKYVTGYERTKIMNSLTKAIDQLVDADDDPKHFVPLSKMREEVTNMLGPFMKEIQDLYSKTKNCESRIQEFVHMVNQLQADQKRYAAGLDQFNMFRRDIADQDAQTKKTNDRIMQVDTKVACIQQEMGDQFADMQKREIAIQTLVDGYEKRCKLMQSDLENHFTTAQEDIKKHVTESNDRFCKLKEEFKKFEAISLEREEKYDAMCKSVEMRLKKSIFEINERHKKEMDAVQRFERGLYTTKQHEKILTTIQPQIKEHAKKLDKLVDIPTFIEHGMPVWNMFQMSDLVKALFCTNNFDESMDERLRKFQMQYLDNALWLQKQGMGFQLDVAALNRRLMSLSRSFRDHQVCLDFKLGTPEGFNRDYAANDGRIDKLHDTQLKSIMEIKNKKSKLDSEVGNFRHCQGLLRHICHMRIVDSKGVEQVNPFRSKTIKVLDRADGNIIEYENSLSQLHDCMLRFNPEQAVRFANFATQHIYEKGHETSHLLAHFVKHDDLEAFKTQMAESAKREQQIGKLLEQSIKAQMRPPEPAPAAPVQQPGGGRRNAPAPVRPKSDVPSFGAPRPTTSPQLTQTMSPPKHLSSESNPALRPSVAQLRQVSLEDTRLEPTSTPDDQQTLKVPSPKSAAKPKVKHDMLKSISTAKVSAQGVATSTKGKEANVSSKSSIKHQELVEDDDNAEAKNSEKSLKIPEVVEPSSSTSVTPSEKSKSVAKVSVVESKIKKQDEQPVDKKIVKSEKAASVKEASAKSESPAEILQEAPQTAVVYQTAPPVVKQQFIYVRTPQVRALRSFRHANRRTNKQVTNNLSKLKTRFDALVQLLPESEDAAIDGMRKLLGVEHEVSHQMKEDGHVYLEKQGRKMKDKVGEVFKAIMENGRPSDFDDKLKDEIVKEAMKNAPPGFRAPDARRELEDILSGEKPEDDSQAFQHGKTNQRFGRASRFKNAFLRQVKQRLIERERPMRLTGNNFNAKQTAEIQQMVDASVDWVSLAVRNALEIQFEDIRSAFYDLRRDQERLASDNEERIQRMSSETSNNTTQVERIFEKFNVDHKQLTQFKRRMQSDLQRDVTALKEVVLANDHRIHNNLGYITNAKQIIEYLLQALMLEALVQGQEAQDKQALTLLSLRTNEEIMQGQRRKSSLESKKSAADQPEQENTLENVIKPKRHLLADEQLPKSHPQHFVQQVRRACMAYNARPVTYRDVQISQSELRQLRDGLLVHAQELFKENYEDVKMTRATERRLSTQQLTKLQFDTSKPGTLLVSEELSQRGDGSDSARSQKTIDNKNEALEDVQVTVPTAPSQVEARLSARLESLRKEQQPEAKRNSGKSSNYDGDLTGHFELGSVLDQAIRDSASKKAGTDVLLEIQSPQKVAEGFELIPHDYAEQLLQTAKRSGGLRPGSREGGLDSVVKDRSNAMRRSLEAMNQAEIDQLLRFQQDLSEHEKALNKEKQVRVAEMALRRYEEIVAKARAAEQTRLKVGGANLASIGLLAKRRQASSREKRRADWRRKSMPEPADTESDNYLQIRPMYGTGQSEAQTTQSGGKLALGPAGQRRPVTQMGFKSTEAVDRPFADRTGLKTSQLARLGIGGAQAKRRITVSVRREDPVDVAHLQQHFGQAAWPEEADRSADGLQDRYLDKDGADSSVSVLQPVNQQTSSALPTQMMSKHASRTIDVAGAAQRSFKMDVAESRQSELDKKRLLVNSQLKQLNTLTTGGATDGAAVDGQAAGSNQSSGLITEIQINAKSPLLKPVLQHSTERAAEIGVAESMPPFNAGIVATNATINARPKTRQYHLSRTLRYSVDNQGTLAPAGSLPPQNFPDKGQGGPLRTSHGQRTHTRNHHVVTPAQPFATELQSRQLVSMHQQESAHGHDSAKSTAIKSSEGTGLRKGSVFSSQHRSRQGTHGGRSSDLGHNDSLIARRLPQGPALQISDKGSDTTNRPAFASTKGSVHHLL